LAKESQKAKEALSAKEAEMTVAQGPAATEVDEETMFIREMADVRPLKEPPKRLVPDPPPPDSFKRPSYLDEDLETLSQLYDLVNGRGEFDLVYSDEYVEGSLKGLPDSILEELRRGRVPYQDYLDLHGLNLAQAEAAIVDFVLKSVSLRRRCLLLVHGRGLRSTDGFPVLKHNLEHLLLRRPIKRHILAFVTAHQMDGGLGASYILLKR
jgi:DNA-nicking Smr family endonuclease